MSYESEPGFDTGSLIEPTASDGVGEWLTTDSERAQVAGVIGGRGLHVEGVRRPNENQERPDEAPDDVDE